MKIWMEITKDKYELPLCAVDSLKELSRVTGVDKESISSVMSRFRKGKIKFSRFIVVEVEDEEAD